MNSKKICGLIAVLLGISVNAWGAPPTKDTTKQADPAHLSLVKRMNMAAQAHTLISEYFSLWKYTDKSKFNAHFKHYLAQISQADDRRTFDLATAELFATLNNGHSGFYDPWLAHQQPHGTGLAVDYQDGAWIVKASGHDAIAPGSVIKAVNGTRVDAFYHRQRKYIPASSDRARRSSLFFQHALFPSKFSVTLDNGKQVTIDRSKPLDSESKLASKTPDMSQGVYYHTIASFADPKYEKAAVEFIKKRRSARAIILDVRGNSGGTTPTTLIKSLITRPYRGSASWSNSVIADVAAVAHFTHEKEFQQSNTPYMSGYLEAMKELDNNQSYSPGEITRPHHPVYKGRLFVLIDRHCASACEDFVMPLKSSHRATLIGERTFGSTGQPYIEEFDNGMMMQVGTRLVTFGDGRRFEGVGVKPDIAIEPTVAQLRAGNDPVLKRAIAVAGKDTKNDK